MLVICVSVWVVVACVLVAEDYIQPNGTDMCTRPGAICCECDSLGLGGRRLCFFGGGCCLLPFGFRLGRAGREVSWLASSCLTSKPDLEKCLMCKHCPFSAYPSLPCVHIPNTPQNPATPFPCIISASPVLLCNQAGPGQVHQVQPLCDNV